MSDHEPNGNDLGGGVADLIKRDVPRAEINRRLGISDYRIRRIADAHGLPDAKTHATRHGASRSLSEKQLRMLAFIQRYTAANSYAPSLREIAEACEISSISVVGYNLRQLEKRDYLTRAPIIPRTIVLTDKGRSELAA